ncbi:hypothetical protein OSTOST_06255 [Ostertagia ostertagi]
MFVASTDALARHLLEGSDTGAEKPGGGGGGVPPGNPSVSASVAIVIVISLVSVSLLITDALARHLLEGSDTGAEKPGGGGGGVPPGNPSVSASVAIVIVISLVSVSLLITGIIIVAVTVDPSSGDDESDIEWDSPRRSNESTELLSDELKDNANFFYAGEIFHEV